MTNFDTNIFVHGAIYREKRLKKQVCKLQTFFCALCVWLGTGSTTSVRKQERGVF